MGIAIALLLISVGLIIVSGKSMYKEKQEQNRIEEYNFAGILNRSEENIDDYKIEIGKLRKEFAETLLEIQGEIVELENKIDTLSEINTNESNASNNTNNTNNTINTTNEVDLISLTEEMKDTVDISINNEKTAEMSNSTEVNLDEKADSSNEKNGVKIKEVERLMEKGLTIDEISDALKIGKGEVLLIKELYLK